MERRFFLFIFFSSQTWDCGKNRLRNIVFFFLATRHIPVCFRLDASISNTLFENCNNIKLIHLLIEFYLFDSSATDSDGYTSLKRFQWIFHDQFSLNRHRLPTSADCRRYRAIIYCVQNHKTDFNINKIKWFFCVCAFCIIDRIKLIACRDTCR